MPRPFPGIISGGNSFLGLRDTSLQLNSRGRWFTPGKNRGNLNGKEARRFRSTGTVGWSRIPTVPGAGNCSSLCMSFLLPLCFTNRNMPPTSASTETVKPTTIAMIDSELISVFDPGLLMGSMFGSSPRRGPLSSSSVRSTDADVVVVPRSLIQVACSQYLVVW